MYKVYIRFGGIGDAITALGHIENGGVYFHSSSCRQFLFGRGGTTNKQIAHVVRELRPDVILTGGGVFSLYALIKSMPGENILISVLRQSKSGRCLNLIIFLLKVFSKLYRRVFIDSYFSGSQYPLVSKDGIILFRNTIKKLKENPVVVGVFYDSKESANNLTIESINSVAHIVWEKFSTNTTVQVFGETHLEGLTDKVENLTGKLSFMQFLRKSKEIDLAICCDSGPMHLQVERNIPTIVFFSLRQEIANWMPNSPNVYPIFMDYIECAGCRLAKCKFGASMCVNNSQNIDKFKKLVDRL